MGFVDAHGHLNCKGRNYDQIKIRGQQIELGKVEANLQSLLPENSRGVVDGVTMGDSSKVLVAFIGLDTASTAAFPEFARHVHHRLAEILPATFIPSSLIRVYEIPVRYGGED
jgi:acyl-coenzyme A synthetase/AMP-(fatty) acid ligase